MVTDIIEFHLNCEMTSQIDCLYDNCKFIDICLRNRESDVLTMIYSEGE